MHPISFVLGLSKDAELGFDKLSPNKRMELNSPVV